MCGPGGPTGHVILSLIFSTFFLILKDTYTFVNLIFRVKGEPLAKYHLALPDVVLSYNMCLTCWISCGRACVLHLCTTSDKIFAVVAAF